MTTEKELTEKIKRHKLNIERTNIDIKKEAHQRMVELLEAELKGSLSKEKEFIKIINELFEKKKISLKELGLPLEDWWGESEVFSVNELEELKNKIKSK